MSVGWNPFFKNESKTCEPWLLHEFVADFYDKELRCSSGWCRSQGLIAALCCPACDAFCCSTDWGIPMLHAALAQARLLKSISS